MKSDGESFCALPVVEIETGSVVTDSQKAGRRGQTRRFRSKRANPPIRPSQTAFVVTHFDVVDQSFSFPSEASLGTSVFPQPDHVCPVIEELGHDLEEKKSDSPGTIHVERGKDLCAAAQPYIAH